MLMFWIKILVGAAVIIFLSYIPLIIKKIKMTKFVVRCNCCNSTDTCIKDNDTFTPVYNPMFKDMAYMREKNPLSFYCNKCQKEYSIKQGTFVRKKENSTIF